MSNQSILYSVSVSPVFCGCQKRKKIPQYVQVRTTELHEQRGSLSSLFPLPCNLDQASRGWEDDILSGLWRQLRQRRAFYTRAKNTQGTKGSNFPILDCKALRGFNALTTTEENQNCFSCRQRADESLFFFQWQLCNITLFCTYCERRFYICVLCCGSGPEPGGFAPKVQNY